MQPWTECVEKRAQEEKRKSFEADVERLALNDNSNEWKKSYINALGRAIEYARWHNDLAAVSHFTLRLERLTK